MVVKERVSYKRRERRCNWGNRSEGSRKRKNQRWGEVDEVKKEAGSKGEVKRIKKSDQLFVQNTM